MSVIEPPEALVDTQCKCGLAGALQVAVEIDGILPLVHGTLCCPFALRKYFLQTYAKEATILATAMGDEDVIYGGRERLRQGIIKVDSLYKPQAILVLSSCMSDTIGDDIPAVVKATQPQVDAKLLYIECGGYKLTETRSFDRTLSVFIPFMEEGKVSGNCKSLNLIGLFGADLYGKSNLNEMRRLLSLCGIQLNCALAGDSSLEEIRRLPQADLNVVVSEARGLETAQKLEERFGIPYLIRELPIGFDSTYQWLSSICERLGIEKEKVILQEKERAERALLLDSKRWCTWDMGGLSNLVVAIFGEFHFIYPLTQFLCEELGMRPVIVGLDNGTTEEQKKLKERLHAYGYENEVFIDMNLNQLEDFFRQIPIDIIFGSSLHAAVAKRAYGRSIPVVKVSSPVFDEIKILDTPIVGFNGTLALCEKALNQILLNLPLMARDICFAQQFM